MKRKSGMLAVGLAILALFALAAIFPGVFSGYGLKEMHAPWLPMSRAHPLGTNDMGYDILTELVHAGGSTLLIGLCAALISLVLGTLIGLGAGYFPGWRGAAAGGLIEIFLMVPMMPMMIVMGAFLGTGTLNIIAIIAALGWCGTARTVRLKTLHLRQSGFVEAMRILNYPRRRIMLRHILPNLREVILSRYIMTVAGCMMMEASLSFLGMGDPTQVTWGRMINLAWKRGGFTRGAWNWIAPPGLCIALIVLALQLINRGLERKDEAVSGGSYLD